MSLMRSLILRSQCNEEAIRFLCVNHIWPKNLTSGVPANGVDSDNCNMYLFQLSAMITDRCRGLKVGSAFTDYYRNTILCSGWLLA